MAYLSHRIEVLLLKTESRPVDSYQEYFSNEPFTPTFVPVLEHRPNVDNLNLIRSLLLNGELGRNHDSKYGGMIFTSQRAVEGFSRVINEVDANRMSMGNWLESMSSQGPAAIEANETSGSSSAPLPLYVVGPATSRTLTSVLWPYSHTCDSTLAPLNPQVFGSHTGNGEALAHYILEHYPSVPGPNHTLPLLFLVGEQRRDIIPKTLMDSSLPENRQIRVDELVVYDTRVMDSFASDFAWHTAQIESEAYNSIAVVVVFSPSGCEAMLRSLGYIDAGRKLTEKGKTRGDARSLANAQPDVQTRYVIATIGPTTRDFLRREFGFEVDVCAEEPSPEGVGEGIKKFLAAGAFLREQCQDETNLESPG